MTKLSPSILSADFANLERDIKIIDRSGCDWIHIDVMDGMFVPNISVGVPIVEAARRCTDKYLDVHLMINDPKRYIGAFKDAGADLLTVHYEACDDVKETIDAIHDSGLDAGIAINPETEVENIAKYIDQVELVLVMTVHPGFGGQTYIDECTEKIAKTKRLKDEKESSVYIEADGGITPVNVENPVLAGADVVVAGSAVFKGDPAKNVAVFKEKLSNIF